MLICVPMFNLRIMCGPFVRSFVCLSFEFAVSFLCILKQLSPFMSKVLAFKLEPLHFPPLYISAAALQMQFIFYSYASCHIAAIVHCLAYVFLSLFIFCKLFPSLINCGTMSCVLCLSLGHLFAFLFVLHMNTVYLKHQFHVPEQ